MKRIPRRQDTFTDAQFLAAFDLARRGLGKVRSSVERDDPARARAELVEYFRTRACAKWTFDLRDGRRGDASCLWPAGIRMKRAQAIEESGNILANRVTIRPGLVLDFGPELAWVTPETRDLGVPGNGFRCCAFMMQLAVAHAATRKATYARKFAELADRWVTDWPFEVDEHFTPRGIVFSREYGYKTLPTGVRLISWFTALYSGILFAPQVPVETAFRLLKVMWFTGLQYLRFRRAPYNGGNHHIMRCGTVPALVALMFPETPVLEPLLQMARETFSAHLERSILSDGGYEERSSSYSTVSLEMMMAPTWIGRRNGVALLDRRDTGRLRRACGRMVDLVLPNGSLPDVGDGTPDPSHTAFFLAMSREAVGLRGADATLRRLRLGRYLPASLRPAPARGRGRAEPPGQGAPPAVCHAPVSGHFLARSGQGSRASAMYLAVPNGENPYTGHSHGEELSLQLVVRGECLVGTPATELYVYVNQARYRSTPARAYLYSTLSHNVVLVGSEALHSLDDLASGWGVVSAPVTCTWSRTARGVHVRASHEGYQGVHLSREVAFDHRSGWTVRDRVRGGGGRRHVLRWNLQYGVELSATEAGFIASRGNAGLAIDFSASTPHRARVYRNAKWLRPNLKRKGQPFPWVVDVTFGGTDDDWIETRTAYA